MLLYGGVSKRHFNMVPIPRGASLGKIRRRGKDSKWNRNFLYALCGGHHHNDPTRPLLEFLSYFALSETYQDIWQYSVALNGVTPIPKIDKVATKEIQSICNINGNYMKILRSCLQT